MHEGLAPLRCSSCETQLTSPSDDHRRKECLGWSPERALLEHEQAEQLLARDFAGPAAWWWKHWVRLREPCRELSVLVVFVPVVLPQAKLFISLDDFDFWCSIILGLNHFDVQTL